MGLISILLSTPTPVLHMAYDGLSAGVDVNMLDSAGLLAAPAELR
jgi:hypothetical protein